MTHRVLVLGAGYARFPTAKRLARQVYPEEVSVGLVTEPPQFVERPRLHQLATGRQLRDLPLTDLLSGTAVGLRVGRVPAVDRAHRFISMANQERHRNTGVRHPGLRPGQHDRTRPGARRPGPTRGP